MKDFNDVNTDSHVPLSMPADYAMFLSALPCNVRPFASRIIELINNGVPSDDVRVRSNLFVINSIVFGSVTSIDMLSEYDLLNKELNK